MLASELPAWLTISQLAAILGLSRRAVAYRVRKGTIPSKKLGPARTAQRVVFLATLEREFPELWQAIILKTDGMGELPDDD